MYDGEIKLYIIMCREYVEKENEVQREWIAVISVSILFLLSHFVVK